MFYVIIIDMKFFGRISLSILKDLYFYYRERGENGGGVSSTGRRLGMASAPGRRHGQPPHPRHHQVLRGVVRRVPRCIRRVTSGSCMDTVALLFPVQLAG